MKMTGVIYADVLVVVNIYITYLLLKSTALLLKEDPDRIRLVIASFSGGFYSLTVLLPEKFSSVLVAFRILAVGLFVFITFGFKSVKLFIRQGICFLLCSFIFAGLMFALWYFICPSGMYFNGSVAYFDIDILTLVILTVVCYSFLKVFDLIFRTRAPVNTVYRLDVFVKGEKLQLKAFLDTGNRLSDPFTGSSVIIVNSACFENIFYGKAESEYFSDYKMRYIFCTTLGGESMLPAFSPDKVFVKGADCSFNIDKAVIALTEERLLQGEYDAILPMGLFENNFDRKDERESEEVTAVF